MVENGTLGSFFGNLNTILEKNTDYTFVDDQQMFKGYICKLSPI